MTVETDLDRAQYATNATTGPWMVPFYFLANAELDVTYTDPTGFDHSLVLDVDYTVVGAGNEAGGTITTATAYPAGGKLVVLRDMQFTQEVVYVDGDSFPAKSHERALDRLTMQTQQLREKLGRALLVPASESSVAPLLAVAARANMLSGFGPTGAPAVFPFYTTATTSQRNFIDVTQVGAKGNGVADDTSFINTAIASISSLGGGTVFLPPGVYMVQGPGISDAVLMQNVTGVTLRGAGVGATVIKLINGANDMTVSLYNTTRCCIRDLCIDGNRANQTAGVHGIRSDTGTDLLVENVLVQNTNSYGLSFGVGTHTRLRLSNVTVLNTTDDGLDLKNPNNDNDQITMDNITIVNPGLGGLTRQTGIDVRGPCRLSNINVRGIQPGNVGVRFRQNGTMGAGVGGNRSGMVNFDIRAATADTDVQGVYVAAYDVQIANGYIFQAAYGLVTLGENTKVSNVIADECAIDFYSSSGVDDFAVLQRGDRASFVGCHGKRAAAGGVYGFWVDPGNSGVVIDDCHVVNSAKGIQLEAGSQALITNTDLSTCTTKVVDNGTLNRFRNVKGYATESNVVTSNLAVDSTGRKQFTINHGLAIQPHFEDITLAVLANSVVADPRYGGLVVDSITPTQINGSLYVTVASATGGAVANVGVRTATRAF